MGTDLIFLTFFFRRSLLDIAITCQPATLSPMAIQRTVIKVGMGVTSTHGYKLESQRQLTVAQCQLQKKHKRRN